MILEFPKDLAEARKEHKEAYEDWLAAEQEAAYEEFLERYYGDSKPVTLDEQHRAAWELKR